MVFINHGDCINIRVQIYVWVMLLYVTYYVVRDISASTDIAYLLDNVVEKGYKITVF